VEYDPEATCPRWDKFLHRIMDGNENLLRFLKRMVGYCLTGDTSEQLLFLLYGTGANGKSTFLETIRCLLGDYARQADLNTFVARSSDAIRNDIARLQGARLVSAVEAEASKKLDEPLIKQITGCDTVTARFLHKEHFEFKPTCKVVLASNHNPCLSGTDEGIWRRIRRVPFGVRIPEPERDLALQGKLKVELSGILRWALEGLADWQREGLGIPEEVKAATDTYREEMDVLADFLSEWCVLNPLAKVSAKPLYEVYCAWAVESREVALTQKAFGRNLRARGLKRQKGTGGYWYWHGIKVKDSPGKEAISEAGAGSLPVTKIA
jgi:putative DNA primase/helicase